MPEWKDTVNLPRTDFPMKANLPTSEPETLARWAAIDLYGKIRARREGAPKFVLHDGPPYANGNIHMGTALNKILKELVVKSRSMAGLRRAVRGRATTATACRSSCRSIASSDRRSARCRSPISAAPAARTPSGTSAR